MRYLEKHIARLLLNNDCVIVPGFGGFMAHNIPAKYDEENCIFIPPMRIVGFNPQLTMNDSLLAQEYVNTYDISFPEALKQIATDVESLKRHIEEEHIYELLRIGKFVINGSTLEFIPEETGVITPALYGLDAINIRPVANTVEEKAIATAKETKTKEREETKAEKRKEAEGAGSYSAASESPGNFNLGYGHFPHGTRAGGNKPYFVSESYIRSKATLFGGQLCTGICADGWFVSAFCRQRFICPVGNTFHSFKQI